MKKKSSITSKLRNAFIAGIVVLVPIGFTLYLTLFLIKISSKLIPNEINPNNYLPFSNKSDNKKSVVLIEYPKKGSWAVGFATKEYKGEISKKTNKELINVFVPTTPNPTSGFLLMFPKDEVIYLDMTFEEASKFIVSAGTSDPADN